MSIRLNLKQQARLKKLAQEGRLRPAEVVDDARPKGSPLHPLFDWDLRKAAEAHWLARAREVIRAVRVRYWNKAGTENYLVSVYVKDPVAPGNVAGYVEAESLGPTPELARMTVMQCLTAAAGLIKRALGYSVALGLEDEIESLMVEILRMRAVLASEVEGLRRGGNGTDDHPPASV